MNTLLRHIEEKLKSKYQNDNKQLLQVMTFANINESTQAIFHTLLSQKAHIHLHFHPDRLIDDNFTLIDGLIADGEYKNQYQTQISSGSLTANIGGDRDIWENALFDNFYGESTQDRPKYGALNLTYTQDGAAPRFGSCFFVTKPEVTHRSTFTFGDSYLLPQEVGVMHYFTPIYVKLYEEVLMRNHALGASYDSVGDFILKTTQVLESQSFLAKNSHNLDFYIEAQIHGILDLKKDIAYLCVDYSYKHTAMAIKCEQLCKKYGITLIWNAGYQLTMKDFPDNFRGINTLHIAKKMAENGVINAYLIGKFLQKVHNEPEYDKHTLFQLAKYVWHCLVKFGKPIPINASSN